MIQDRLGPHTQVIAHPLNKLHDVKFKYWYGTHPNYLSPIFDKSTNNDLEI